ncbi:MAG: copper resistance protein CopC [Acidobacteria bacterium]|nr:copper resistance protein CopC [Acidobacteriota bacterium]MBV9482174.1 copper resistance protein CopC [Acidobacteriota bacterium]
MSKREPVLQFMLGLGVLLAVFMMTDVAGAASLKVRDSIPESDAVIRGNPVEYVIRFDGIIEHAFSRIDITQSGRVIQSFPVFLGSAPNVLFALGEAPAPGPYVLHWQAKSAIDGSISSGEIPFYVKQ